jgi:alpha-glucoside transport system substrate-binding protein
MWALSDQMVADGVTPWCGGLESGSDTGWPASDWLAQVMLRLFGSDVYDQWVGGDLPFSSPEVGAAMDIVAGWMKNPRYVNGGYGDVGTIPVTPVGEAGVGIPSGECGMLQQGPSAEDLWGTVGEGVDGDTEVGPTGDVYAFYLPEVTPDFPQPVVSDGLFAVAFADRPEVQAVQTYLASPEFHTSRVARGGWVSANTGVPLDTYPVDSIEQMTAGYLTDPKSTVRLDASDLMPAVVGEGALPEQMTAWFADQKSTADSLAAIDAAWPPQ